jgi:hypothetical protein
LNEAAREDVPPKPGVTRAQFAAAVRETSEALAQPPGNISEPADVLVPIAGDEHRLGDVATLEVSPRGE